ncbi:hypothetical protein AEA09_12990 [Lysinibacillus contaminans]|uniref:Glycosyl transferase family 1 n=1 Tax=Lysinibacillus contaminans TaxID=1293441 RepID=A0ABR5K3D3_9BACI|nr:glycosyltransferase [Lysinibacillus contaminans]KOS69381.1 hypothetical protein AEA09_12990 [Lysinibacillus contaminans]
MKRILVVIDNLNRGGIASVVLNISEVMDKEKFKFDYITYQEPDIDISNRLEKFNSKYFVVRRLSETSPLKYVNQIRQVIKKNGPYDVIHAHTSSFIWLACLAAKIEKIPIRIGHAHGSKNAKKFLFSNVFYFILRYFNRKFCTEMITCAESSGVYVFGKNYKFLPNFIDHTQYGSMNIEEKFDFMDKYNIPQNTIIFCFIGYLGGEKNPMFALELFKEILSGNTAYYLLIAGDGPANNEIKEFIKDNHMTKNVIMFGNTNEVKEILQISNIMLMPSITEGMSIAAIEAQISGVNCIISSGVPKTNDIKAGLFHQCETLVVNDWIYMVSEVLKKEHTKSHNEVIQALINIGYDKESVKRRLESIY